MLFSSTWNVVIRVPSFDLEGEDTYFGARGEERKQSIDIFGDKENGYLGYLTAHSAKLARRNALSGGHETVRV
jgi:hypothetical protein